MPTIQHLFAITPKGPFLPTRPVSCAGTAGPLTAGAWEAPDTRFPGDAGASQGLSFVKSLESAAAHSFTLEMWLQWPPAGLPLSRPETFAEAVCGDWHWRLYSDEFGKLTFSWRAGSNERTLAGASLVDAVRPGAWYHLALQFFDMTHTGEAYAADYSMAKILLTEAGQPMPTSYAMTTGFATGPAVDLNAPWLSVGRVVANPQPGRARIGSAAFHLGILPPASFKALGGAPVPAWLQIDAAFDNASLENMIALTDDTFAFDAKIYSHHQNYWFAFKATGVQGQTLTFIHPNGNGMASTAFISEDDGKSWQRPSGGVRRLEGAAYSGHLVFKHTFHADAAVIATTPMVTNRVADDWLQGMAAKPGVRLHDLGLTQHGQPLKAVEAGNPDRPLVYMQAGQHSMAERLGFYVMAAMFECALADPELLALSRWIVLPVVNLDSDQVCPTAADTNMNRLWATDRANRTVAAVQTFLENQTAQHGVAVILDFHAGGIWDGHHVLDKSGGRFSAFENGLRAAGLPLTFHHWAPGPGGFTEFGLALNGGPVSLAVELAQIATVGAHGAEPVSIENLQTDGRKWYQAIRRHLLSA